MGAGDADTTNNQGAGAQARGRVGDAAPPMGADEATLTEFARSGNRAAFDRLIAVYDGQLRGFLLRRVGPGAPVEDLAQDVWLAGWVAMPRFQKRSSFRTWLFSIAVNKCMDYHRAQGRHGGAPVSLDDSGLAERADGLRSPEELYAAAELRETVRGLIEKLPPPQREVLDLYYYAELTLPEIATALHRNLNTVKYQFYRAHDLVGQGLNQTETVNGGIATPPLPNTAKALRPEVGT